MNRSRMPVLISLFALSFGIISAFAGDDRGEATRSLHQAVVDGDTDQVQSLISRGADINGKNMLGWTPLHTAVQNRRKAVAEVLIDKGADINAKDQSGQTPLHVAVDTGQKDVVELLIAKGADINAASSRGENALSLAKKRERAEIVDFLLQHGAKEPTLDLTEGRLYGLEEGQERPSSRVDYPQQVRPEAGPGAKPDPNALANILADPNAIIARIKAFEGLDKALGLVDGRSRYEVREWLEKRTDNRVDLAKAIDRQVSAEIRFIRDVAVEEKTKKTTDAIDALLSSRQGQSKRLVADMEEEIKAQRPIRATRGRSGSRYPSSGQRYPQEQLTRDRTTPYSGRTRQARGGLTEQDGFAARESRPGTAPAGLTDGSRNNEIEVSVWMQRDPEGRIDLADAVHNQVAGQIVSIRRIAVVEKANKTTAAIDGVLLDRQKRLDKLVQVLEKEIAGPLGRRDTYYNQGQRPGQGEPVEPDNQPRPQPRRR